MINPHQVPERLARDPAQHASSGADLPSRKLSVKEAAAFLGLSVSTMNKMRLSGTGPRYLKLGRRVLYDIRDLEDWAARQRRQNTSEGIGQ